MNAADGLLTLCMIVKDESEGIARTLASIKPWIDRWLIVDTGSADDTREIVRTAMAGVPGALHEAPFVDFSTTRNHALSLCGGETEFILSLDADDELEGGGALRSFLQSERAKTGPEHEAYRVRVDFGTAYDSVRVKRRHSGWRFVGAVHEILVHPERNLPSLRVPGAIIRHRPGPRSVERSRARWERDRAILERAVAANPSDTRSVFYLAQTCRWLGDVDAASEHFIRRIALGGWREEVYESRLQLAAIAEAGARPWPEVQQLYLDAHAAAPHRAEPLHAIARHHDEHGEHALCLLFATRGLELPARRE
jgi:glycosyltransferase involved in cell wall biosynthesis